MTETKWSVSGLCVTALPERLAAVEEMLNRRPGIEVRARDLQRGKLVVVQERATVEEHRKGLRELQTLPGVLTAELVLHYLDPDQNDEPSTSGGAS